MAQIVTVTVNGAVVAELMAELPADTDELLKRYPGAILTMMSEEERHATTLGTGTYAPSSQQVDF